MSAQISAPGIALRSGQIGDALNTPFYCVSITTYGAIFSQRAMYKIIVNEAADGRYVFSILSSRRGIIYTCDGLAYKPFPELTRAL